MTNRHPLSLWHASALAAIVLTLAISSPTRVRRQVQAPVQTPIQTPVQTQDQTQIQTDDGAQPPRDRQETSDNSVDNKKDHSQAEDQPKQSKKAKRKARAEEAEDLPAVLMQELPDPASLNLYYGEGGQQDAPAGDTYTFVSEDLSQTQPKFDVKDAQGRRWRIKLGPEYKPETAATRLVWAAGYYVDEDYNLDEVSVQGLPRLRRGERYVKDGVVHEVRLKLEPKKQKTIGYWKWSDNPFAGSRELNGLRVVMALINNWDLIGVNNKIYEADGQRRYVVSDLGASFGKSGNEFTRKKGNLEAYAQSRFIARMTSDTVDFAIHSRPLPFMAFGFGVFVHHPNYYFDLVHGEQVVKRIPRADARWIGQRLANLSDQQLRDCFRAAGFSPEEVAGYAGVVRERITELAGL